MSEDQIKQEEGTKQEATAVELSPVELEASESGWVPKDQWVEQGGNPEEWRTAREFVARGELYKSLHQTRRDLKQTQTALTALQKHHQYVFERAHAKAMEDLKREKRAAIRNEDFEHLEYVEERIEELNKAHNEEQVKLKQANEVVEQANVGPHPEFVAWQERNQWYVEDADLREFADAQGLIYMNKNPGVQPDQVLKHVEQKVQRYFPDKFKGRKAAPNAVAGVNRSGGTSKQKLSDDIDLDEMERDIMNTFVKTGVMTEQEYKAELRKARGG